jgi:uncharacterized protein (DUF934 family)
MSSSINSSMSSTFEILSADTPSSESDWLSLGNDADANAVDLQTLAGISLHFPKFSDGRAFSQAVILRRRGFEGDIRALGDVLIDQLLQMQRCGFSSAVLRADQDAAHGQRLMQHYSGFYQGDIRPTAPRFAQTSA